MIRIFREYTMSWLQVGLLKISMMAFGLAIGATWPELFRERVVWLWLMFALPAVYLGIVFYPSMWGGRK